MQNMYPVTQRPFNAAIEVRDLANVARLANKIYPGSGDSPYDWLGVVKNGTVIDYLNLHFLSTRILRQYTSQRFLQIPGPVVCGDHHRPKGPSACLGGRPNSRRSEE